MNRLLYQGILLAQQGRLEGLSSGFRGRRARFDTGDIVTAVLIVVGIAVGLGILSYVLRLQERRRGYTSPLRLFLSLCRAHRLPWSARWLLWRVSRAQQLRDPARLFLEPERLEAAQLVRKFKTRQTQLSQIRERLFDGLEQGEADGEPAVEDVSAGCPAGTPAWPILVQPGGGAKSDADAPAPSADLPTGGPL
jgi:hypothetical protein